MKKVLAHNACLFYMLHSVGVYGKIHSCAYCNHIQKRCCIRPAIKMCCPEDASENLPKTIIHLIFLLLAAKQIHFQYHQDDAHLLAQKTVFNNLTNSLPVFLVLGKPSVVDEFGKEINLPKDHFHRALIPRYISSVPTHFLPVSGL